MRKLPSRTGVGASSILLILVAVAMTLFAVLSLVTARNDKVLTDRAVAATSAYYRADSEAQRALADIDAYLATGDKAKLNGRTLTQRDDGALAFTVATDDGHALEVTLQVANQRATVTGYRYVYTGAWTADATQQVWGSD